MGPEIGYSLEQLMELAGLAVAQATHDFVQTELKLPPCRVLTVCGPGNNGGDVIVAARHLSMFGYTSSLYYPKST